MSSARDEASVVDMLLAARRALDHVKGMTFEDFMASAKTQDAVARTIEVIGEAAKRVSAGFREAHMDVQWKEAIGMRDVVSHQYDRVDWRTVWATIHDDLPALIEALEPLIPPEPA